MLASTYKSTWNLNNVIVIIIIIILTDMKTSNLRNKAQFQAVANRKIIILLPLVL
jgi:hypothetical protein